ncbi:MAG: peptidase [Chitinophagaceae bacterium]|nr:MAG: peptidase [Chitinophagaceae bacterium]
MKSILPLIILATLLCFVFVMLNRKKKSKQALIADDENLLNANVLFYKNLEKSAQLEFVQRVRKFLAKVLITGVETNVENLDRILIAAAAIIPIFHFKNWEYKNLDEVLVYPHSFSSAFSLEGDGRNVIGMVGTGPMERTMILSKPDLRAGFSDPLSKSNTAIHEFVHLIDKSDGSTDGLPSVLLEHQYAMPWLSYINTTIQAIEKGDSDINPYAQTNPAEFFAVVSEYFFKRPELLQEHHPQLFELLETIFKNKED